jgi:hypothetical protein
MGMMGSRMMSLPQRGGAGGPQSQLGGPKRPAGPPPPPQQLKKKLRIFISNTSFPVKEGEEESVATWEMRVEGRLMDEDIRAEYTKVKRKFSSFFKSLVIELHKEMYGPDNHAGDGRVPM